MKFLTILFFGCISVLLGKNCPTQHRMKDHPISSLKTMALAFIEQTFHIFFTVATFRYTVHSAPCISSPENVVE